MQVPHDGEFDLHALKAEIQRPLSTLDIQPIERKLAAQGSPELKRHWRIFVKSGVALDDVSFETLHSQSASHCTPLFGKPIVSCLLLTTLAIPLSYYIASTIEFRSRSLVLSWIGGTLSMGCSIILFTYLLTLLQRRFFWPMESILARSTAHSLSQKNYRKWNRSRPGWDQSMNAIKASGVSNEWDNPNYLRWYRRDGDDFHSVPPRTEQEVIREELLKFLGTFDKETRKHLPGNRQSHLRNGKRSVTRFVKANQQKLNALRDQTLENEDAWSILQSLLDTEVRSGSGGEKSSLDVLKNRESGSSIPDRIVQAQIWQRDPWQDLCSQKDFYSSASLRGVDAVGRSTKGRMSPFQYLEATSITALDFSDRRGRAVRARLLIGFVPAPEQQNQLVLFVDGVEGSNRISRKAILKGITDYARAIGVSAILFYRYPHNTIPKRFVQILESSSSVIGDDIPFPIRTVEFHSFGLNRRQYLDAFGWPVEPFEYAYAKGQIIVHVHSLDGESKEIGRAPRVSDYLWVHAKRNCLWFILTISMMFAVLTLSISTPWMLVPLVIFAATGIWLHLRTQQLGLERRAP